MKKLKFNHELFIFFVIMAGIILRLIYIHYTPYYIRQNDSYEIGVNGGHLYYIEYLYNNLKIPDFNPTTVWQFYHPPLHHILSALWLKLNVFFGVNYIFAVENLQYLTALYSSLCMIVIYQIFLELTINKKAIHWIMPIIATHPQFILLSGNINNDILSILFIFLSILYLLKWCKHSNIKNTLLLSLFFSLGCLSKFSCILISPVIGFVFLYKLIKERKQSFIKLAKQFLLFGTISIPLSLSWSIYLFFKWKLEFGYIPNAADNTLILKQNFINRIFIDELSHLSNPFLVWNGSNKEYNIFTIMNKTSMFGETILTNNSLIKTLCLILMYINIVLMIFGLTKLILTINKSSFNQILLLIIYLTFMLSYISFCFKYPNISTPNFRYIVPTLLPLLYGVSRLINDSKYKISRILIYMLIFGFCVLSVYIYIILGII